LHDFVYYLRFDIGSKILQVVISFLNWISND